MLETQAKVVAVEPGYAWVESERRSGCSHCTGSDNCGVASLGKSFGVRRHRMRVPDPLGVQPGENIIIGLSERRLVAAAASAYLLPLVAMIAMALFSARLGYGQGALAVSSLAGLAGGLGWLRHRAGSARALGGYRPVILKRLPASAGVVELKPETIGVNHE